MTECKDCCDQLSDYLDGEISDDECRYIEDHLDRCPPCAMFFESLKTTVSLCGRALPAEIPEETRQALKEFLRRRCRRE
jgi:anti-sigma factor RsiW